MTVMHAPEQNHLLAALPVGVRKRIFARLKLIEISQGDVIYESGQPLEYVYFPTDCVISLLQTTVNGASAAISVVGNDGIVGVSVFMGGESTSSHAVVQSSGCVYRMSSMELKEEFNADAEVRLLMLRYTQALITQMSQTAVCNRHHSIDQQLCRWLLLSLDRLAGNRLTITQELIANTLGVRREGVTKAAGKLQSLGIIRYHRGQITVIDRPALETMCCECYSAVKCETDRLSSYGTIL